MIVSDLESLFLGFLLGGAIDADRRDKYHLIEHHVNNLLAWCSEPGVTEAAQIELDEEGLTTPREMPIVDSCSTPIASNSTPSLESSSSDINCPRHLDVTHYVIVRADLTHGQQVAQTIHAAGESTPTRLQSGTIAVALHARDEAHLKEVGDILGLAGIAYHRVEECDGELMAIGVEPTTDRKKVRKALSKLPLVR